MTVDKLTFKKIPDSPGVYFFLGAQKEILYIGKATNLRNRIKSYFAPDVATKRSPLIENMVTEAKSVDWTVTDSVLEALILESNLIRTHKPTYNTIAKDDKSYNHLVITNEKFPRVLVVRGKDLVQDYTEDEILYHFGPFTSGLLFKEALKIVRRLFKFYDTKDPIGSEKSKISKGKIDFNRQIGLYPSSTSQKEYAQTIRHIRLFFEGKKHQIINELEKDMMRAAQQEKFELAHILKKKIFALTHIQDVALLKDETRTYRDHRSVRIEAYDVAHLGGSDMVGVMTVLQNGEVNKSEYRKFKIKTVHKSNDTAALREMLDRRLQHPEWPLPILIVVDGSTAQKNAAEKVLKKHAISIPVVGVVKDEHHQPKRLLGATTLIQQHRHALLLANAEAHRFAVRFHRERRSKNNFSRT